MCTQTVFVPWNVAEVHWALVEVDGNKRRVRVYDSLNKKLPRSVALARFLEAAGAGSYPVKLCKSPTQPDGNSCGLFVALNLWHLARRKPLPQRYDLSDVRALRERLARALVTGDESSPLE